MLWKQESENNSVYIDLLIESKHSKSYVTASRKNNELSVSARVIGNEKLLNNDYEGAMQMYNRSASFARDNEHLSLAYANRSCCFMKINLFEKCLIDIQKAIDAQYPENLMPKLYKRKQFCLEKLKAQTHSPSTKPKLSYDCDSNLPCMATVLTITMNEQYGRLITAECNIPIGKTLLVEEAYIRVATGNECSNCAKKNMNLFPCLNCVDVMYCSEKCAQNNWHEIECNIIFGSDDLFGTKSSSFVLRSVMIGISMFTTIEEMMEFVKFCQLTGPKEINQSLNTPQSKYQAFLKLSTTGFVGQVRAQSSSIFHTMMRSNVANKFDTLAKRRFLVHLICHHSLIAQSNAFGGLCNPPDEVSECSHLPAEIDTDFERNLFLVTSYFNHSCLPNTTKLSMGNLAVVKAIQPIEKGQQLFVTYLAGELTERSTKDRNDELDSSYGFRCKCGLCTIEIQPDAFALEADPDFQYVVANLKHFRILLQPIKQACIQFLVKHCHNIASKPAYFILYTLTAMLQKELEE